MKKRYGRNDPFASIIGAQLKPTKVTSDSSLSPDDISSSSSSSGAGGRLTRAKPGSSAKNGRDYEDNGVLGDVSNARPRRNKANKTTSKPQKKKAVADIGIENVPDFDVFDDYRLNVQPMSPIKTHVSITNSSGLPWDDFSTRELLAEIAVENLAKPVASSPRPTKGDKLLPCSIEISYLDMVQHKQDSSISRSQKAQTACSPQMLSPVYGDTDREQVHLPVSMQTRRAKRLRQRLGDSMNTSTPEQVYRKLSRLVSPTHRMELSQIPTLDVDEEFVASMNHMTLHESLHESVHESLHESVHESLHESLRESPREMQFPLLSGHIDESQRVVDSPSQHEQSGSDSDSDSLSLFSIPQHGQSLGHSSYEEPKSGLSASLFTASLRTLDSIIEEEDEEGEEALEINNSLASPSSLTTSSQNFPDIAQGADLSSEAYHTAPDSLSGSYLTPIRSAFSRGISEEDIVSFETVSPTIVELSQKRRMRKLLRECLQTRFYTWSEYMPNSEMEKLVKIGEGVYGEVFRYETGGEIIIIKVVPMEGECTVNDEPQKKFHEMCKEIKVTKELSRVGYNFIHTKRVVCTQGLYPDILLKKWDDFALRKESENDRPDYFTPEQYYTIFEFSNGGEALESYEFKNAAEGLSCLLQVGWSLAVAEDDCQFEHRDLHWSNVLVAECADTHLSYRFESDKQEEHSIESSGVKVHIIDFTLARLRKDDEVLFCDLSEDETLFQGHGDYQFDVYRQMKDITRNDWMKFYSVTNILWMRYLADKLLRMKSFPSKRGTSPTAAQFKKALLGFYERCAHYHSAVQMVLTDELFLEYSSNIAESFSTCDDTR